MSNFTNGAYKVLSIKVRGNYLPVGCLTENSFSESVETISTTVRTNPNGWSTSRPTIQSYNIDFSGLILQDSLSAEFCTFNDIRTFKRGRELIEWKIENDVGVSDYGKGYIVSLGDTANIDEFVSFNGSITGYGEPISNPDIIGALDEELNFEL